MRGSQIRPVGAHALGLGQLLAWGSTFYAVVALGPALETGLGVSPRDFSNAMTLGLLGSAVASLLVGRWMRTSGARKPMVASAVLGALALLLLATADGPRQALAGVMLVGVAQAGLLYEPAFVAIAQQGGDEATRGRAMRVVTLWGGFAALLFVPTVTLLVEQLTVGTVSALLAVTLVVGTIPIHMRLPASDKRAPVRKERPVTRAGSFAAALGFGLAAVVSSTLLVHGLSWLLERGATPRGASLALGLLAPAQVASRILATRGGATSGWAFGLIAVGIAAFAFTPHLPALAAFVVLFGSGSGLLITARAGLLAAHARCAGIEGPAALVAAAVNVARGVAPAGAAWIREGVGEGPTLALLIVAITVAGGLVHLASNWAPCQTRTEEKR